VPPSRLGLLALLLAVAGLIGAARAAIGDVVQLQTPEDNAICLGCHATAAAGRVDAQALARSVHADRTCTDCHSDVTTVPHPRTLKPVRCERCHYVREVITTTGPGAPKRSDLSVHEQAARAGKPNVPTCTQCHGSGHDIEPPSSPDSHLGRPHIVDTCGACHPEVARRYRQSIHGQALARGNPDVPTCDYCHREHPQIAGERHAGIRAAGVVATCVSCHEDPGLQRRYHLPANRLVTYLGSYHGASQRLGDTRTANCASCHGAHFILPSSDPRSTINKANLARTCSPCHPGAGKRFAQGTIHIQPSPTRDRAIFWVRVAYTLFVLAMMSAFIGYIALDLLTRFRKRRARQQRRHEPEAPEPEFERLSLNQRLQHWLLITSFVTLLVTGLPLLFPTTSISRDVVHLLGGVGARAVIHRIAALTLIGLVVYHALYVLFSRKGYWEFRQLLPGPRDLLDLLHMLRYYFGLSQARPAFGRYNYIEKFEYLAVGWGSVIMIGTGLVLWSPNVTLAILPKWVTDIATVVHSWEAILAFLAIIVWHMYNVHWNPSVFPMSRIWLTGKIGLRELEENHPLEYRERYGGGQPGEGALD
jgi:cytochrome b subunit of formate dehydrogenase